MLDTLNNAADGLPIGSVVVNNAGGVAGHNTIVRFPNAHAEEDTLTATRQWMWHSRRPGAPPPAVFQGFAEQHVEHDPTYAALTPQARHRSLLVGRNVDVASSTARFALDATPGRHLAVLGPSALGADVLHAAVGGLAKQHTPGPARFVVASLVQAAETVAADAITALRDVGHDVDEVDAVGLRTELTKLAVRPEATDRPPHTYVIVFGMDAAAGVLARPSPDNPIHTGRTHLRAVLKDGPGHGVHLLAWWRGLQRFSEDIGGAGAREDIACMVALNIDGNNLGIHLGDPTLQWSARPNRALMIDLHNDHRSLIVPFQRPGRHDGTHP